MLEAREEGFRRTLDRLAGRVEWGVKVYAESEEQERPQEPAKVSSGRDYLRQRRRSHRAHEEMWESADRFARGLHGTLSEFAEDTRLHAPQNSALSGVPGRNVLNAAYLVPRAHSEEFVELVDRTKGEEPGLRVELTGPWAAYSFSGESEEGREGVESVEDGP